MRIRFCSAIGYREHRLILQNNAPANPNAGDPEPPDPIAERLRLDQARLRAHGLGPTNGVNGASAAAVPAAQQSTLHAEMSQTLGNLPLLNASTNGRSHTPNQTAETRNTPIGPDLIRAEDEIGMLRTRNERDIAAMAGIRTITNERGVTVRKGWYNFWTSKEKLAAKQRAADAQLEESKKQRIKALLRTQSERDVNGRARFLETSQHQATRSLALRTANTERSLALLSKDQEYAQGVIDGMVAEESLLKEKEAKWNELHRLIGQSHTPDDLRHTQASLTFMKTIQAELAQEAQTTQANAPKVTPEIEQLYGGLSSTLEAFGDRLSRTHSSYAYNIEELLIDNTETARLDATALDAKIQELVDRRLIEPQQGTSLLGIAQRLRSSDLKPAVMLYLKGKLDQRSRQAEGINREHRLDAAMTELKKLERHQKVSFGGADRDVAPLVVTSVTGGRFVHLLSSEGRHAVIDTNPGPDGKYWMEWQVQAGYANTNRYEIGKPPTVGPDGSYPRQFADRTVIHLAAILPQAMPVAPTNAAPAQQAARPTSHAPIATTDAQTILAAPTAAQNGRPLVQTTDITSAPQLEGSVTTTDFGPQLASEQAGATPNQKPKKPRKPRSTPNTGTTRSRPRKSTSPVNGAQSAPAEPMPGAARVTDEASNDDRDAFIPNHSE